MSLFPLPRQPTSQPPASLQGYYAGFVSRLLAFVIDVVIVSLLFVSVTWITTVTVTTLRLGSYLGISLNSLPGGLWLAGLVTSPAFIAIVTLLFIMSYHVFFWIFAGQTPGKALLGLRLVTLNGRRIPAWRAVVRYLAYYPSALLLFVGFAWVLFDDRRQAWHDKLAGTLVVYAWDARPDENFLADEIREVNLPALDNSQGLQPPKSPS